VQAAPALTARRRRGDNAAVFTHREVRMSTAEAHEHVEKLNELVRRLGGISLDRIVSDPPPGTATEKDLLRLMRRTGRHYELVDGVLVEKTMGYSEGSIAGRILHFIADYLEEHDLGDVAGADATMRLMKGLVRLPDVSFTRWEKFPGGKLPTEPIPDLAPDLAIEVLSKKNTPGEMRRKLKEYFLAGTSLVWLVDPRKRTVTVHTAPDAPAVLTEADTLDGGEVLPGFSLPVKRIFERLPATPGKPRRRSRK
jgi:Uma2 family endonuclease